MKQETPLEAILAGISLVIAICAIVFMLSVMHTDYIGGAIGGTTAAKDGEKERKNNEQKP